MGSDNNPNTMMGKCQKNVMVYNQLIVFPPESAVPQGYKTILFYGMIPANYEVNRLTLKLSDL